jgi:hypothetical protein
VLNNGTAESSLITYMTVEIFTALKMLMVLWVVTTRGVESGEGMFPRNVLFPTSALNL